MAVTDFAALDSARKKVWAAEIWQAGRDANFWMSNGFVGTGQNSVIQRITELTRTDKGDECIMQLVADLQQDGVAGDNLLEGNEEPMFNDSLSLRLDQLRHGVRSKGQMSEQRTVVRFRTTAKDKLSFWFADKIDELLFLVAAGIPFNYNLDGTLRATNSQLPALAFNQDITAPSSARTRFMGSATSKATLTAGDKMNWNAIVQLQSQAKRKRMKPIRSGGREYFALLISTEQCRDLKTDTTYQTLVSRSAPRGDGNPLFKNALSVIDGCVIYEHNKVPNTLGLPPGQKWGAAGTVDGAQAMLLGAQSLGFATISDMEYEESDNTDYKNRQGISVGRMFGMVKPQFSSPTDGGTKQDFAITTLYTAAGATA
jgi:N4-gp56 family major capsid protein